MRHLLIWLVALGFALFSTANASTFTKTTPSQFDNKIYAIKEYATNGAQTSDGVMQTWADGRIELYYFWHQTRQLAERVLAGQFNVQNGQFCYKFTLGTAVAQDCARIQGDYLVDPDGTKSWLAHLRGSTGRKQAKLVFKRYAGDAVVGAPAAVNLSKNDRLRIQYYLAKLGFNPGPADGAFGRKTRAAIKAWQGKQRAPQTGNLTSEQANFLLRGAPSIAEIQQQIAADTPKSCSNPMTSTQLLRVQKAFKAIAPDGDGFKIDACRNIRLTMGKKTQLGFLHDLGTELNFAHHDYVYLGLIRPKEWSIPDSYIFRHTSSKSASAKQFVDWNLQIVKLLKLAGYPNDPNADKRAEIIERDMDRLQRPDLGENFGALMQMMRDYGDSAPVSTTTQSAPAAEQQAGVKLYKHRCDVRCPIINADDGKVTVRDVMAKNSNAAERLLQDRGLGKICLDAGYKDWNRLVASAGVYCRP
ncbi:MAG: peptidoglycan-binding domain-containing protein [Pikeienuella sp.]